LASPLVVEQWPIERFRDYERNPRKNDGVVDRMVEAICEWLPDPDHPMAQRMIDPYTSPAMAAKMAAGSRALGFGALPPKRYGHPA
jgi:hypothetical protein